ncbi:IclR family transcriptional regulator [Paraferrimonas sp. SM1919]|uniref:IclR family transcriptional regulator n=1 Tax=Paraferrimonas sp. SM1919 TaxID=2662263 RepID=UPI0013D4E665|nr:IclR family transcriptional regulator [Paraferrimonas sp. SM1919]
MNNYIIPNLANACDVLIALTHTHEGMSAVEMSNKFSLPRTTVFRILKTLEKHHLIEKQGKIFVCGPNLIRMGINLVNSNKLKEKSLPVLQHIAQHTGFTAHVVVPNGNKSLILEVVDSSSALRVASRPGSLADLHCSASGKLFLSHLFYNQLEQVLELPLMQRTTATITDLELLKKELARVEELGYAIDNLEYNDNVRCLAVPVRDNNGQVVAAIGITAPAMTFKLADIASIASFLKEMAIKLSFSTFYKGQ